MVMNGVHCGLVMNGVHCGLVMNGVHCGLVMNGVHCDEWWSSTKSTKWLYLYALVFCVIINSKLGLVLSVCAHKLF